MAFEHRLGDGTLYREREKRNDRAPDWTGFAVAHRDIKAGERIRIAAWEKTPTMLSLKISDERERRESGDAATSANAYRNKQAPSSSQSTGDVLEDDLPF